MSKSRILLVLFFSLTYQGFAQTGWNILRSAQEKYNTSVSLKCYREKMTNFQPDTSREYQQFQRWHGNNGVAERELICYTIQDDAGNELRNFIYDGEQVFRVLPQRQSITLMTEELDFNALGFDPAKIPMIAGEEGFNMLYLSWLKVYREHPDYWVIKSNALTLWVGKSDTLIHRLEFEVNQDGIDYWERLTFYEQRLGEVDLMDQKAFDLSHYLEKGYTLTTYEETSATHQAARTEAINQIIGTHIPNFSLQTIDGISISVEGLAGKVVLLDFWYVGCRPCMEALPEIERLKRRYPDSSLAIIGINPIDEQGIPLANFLATHESTSPTVVREGLPHGFFDFFSFSFAYPAFILIDQTGRVQQITLGYSASSFRALEDQIKGLLENGE